jgi:hypothetical protein
MTAFTLPRGNSNWHLVKQQIEWCKEMFGPRVFGGPWEYNAVHHMIVIKDPEMVLLYKLRWT